MERNTNTRPLLERSESDSDFDEEIRVNEQKPREEDDVDFKDSQPVFCGFQPIDKYNVSYAIFYVLGTIILLPWFFFMTADEYWMYKFRPLRINETMTSDGRSDLQASFMSYMTMAATVPSTLFLIINPMINHLIPLNVRMLGSLFTMLVLFLLTTILVKVNTDSWQQEFFLVTLAIVIVLNIASANLQSALFGVVGKFPSKYISGTVSGQALGGIFAAIAEIGSLSVGASPITSALVYFITADLFIVVSIISYMFLISTIFFKFHCNEISIQGSIQYEQVTSVDKEAPIVRDISYIGILRKISVHGLCLWYCFLVMFSVYPSIAVLVKSTSQNGSEWSDKYFVPVITFLLYGVCDYSGRLIAGYLQWPGKRKWILALMSIVRTVFIPLIVFCNAQPRNNLPVLIFSDWLYILIIIGLSFSNGYLTNITFISVPKIVAVHEQEVASTMLAAFLGLGIACGSGISIGIVKYLKM